jgi:hypothetical protein
MISMVTRCPVRLIAGMTGSAITALIINIGTATSAVIPHITGMGNATSAQDISIGAIPHIHAVMMTIGTTDAATSAPRAKNKTNGGTVLPVMMRTGGTMNATIVPKITGMTTAVNPATIRSGGITNVTLVLRITGDMARASIVNTGSSGMATDAIHARAASPAGITTNATNAPTISIGATPRLNAATIKSGIAQLRFFLGTHHSSHSSTSRSQFSHAL